jgi:ankyrin repeat protein
VDSQNVEGFTALHFASFHGRYAMIEALVEDARAEVSLANKDGCNVLHLAAQGNKALSIYYFGVRKGVDVNSRDSRQSTPLHWACYTRSENAL